MMLFTSRKFPPLFVLSALVCLVAFACLPLRAQSQGGIRLDVIGKYSTGLYGVSAAEISAYDHTTKRLFMINATAAKVDVISLANPVAPVLLSRIDASMYGAGINSVAVHNGLVAVAIENSNKQANGSVAFYTADGVYINRVDVGALPDMLTFTPDGTKVLVANEGEPNSSYTVDPEGSVSIIDLSAGVANITQADVRTAGFTAFNNTTLEPSIRIFGPNATVAQDLEPEYITVSADSKTAWVTIQEANAIGVIDIASATVISLKGLGFKDHNIVGQGLDASDRDNMINIRPWPVKGMYQPDGIASYNANGQTYLVMANEGDSRDYSAFAEESRVKDLKLDPVAFPTSANYRADANLGRLTVTKTLGDANKDGLYEELYVLGARSFSIRTTTASLVWDSGDKFEQITAQMYPANFNASNDDQAFDNRSDNKGPEPEGVTLGQIGDSMYAFIGLERIGGVMVYNITNPQSPTFVQYINPRNFATTNMSLAGELGPEGILFIPWDKSPNKRDLLVVSNEISGSVTIYQIMPQLTPGSAVKLREYQLRTTPQIGMFNSTGLYEPYFEGGMSGLDRILGKDNEFMLVTDRGPNVEATNHPLAGGQTTLLFPFPNYAPKIFHMKAEGDSLRIISSTTLKRPDGTSTSGLPNPSNAGGTGEIAWNSTNATVLAPDAWGIDSEGIVEGNNNDYWICEEYGTTVWNVEKGTGRVINRYTPFGSSDHNIGIPPAFAKRRPNRGFEGVAITPSGKVYIMVQGPLYNPNSATGNTSRLHRLLEIDPATNAMRMFAYEHDADLGQIRSSDWKIGDMVAVNDHEFLVIEHAERNGWNYKNIYKIDVTGATPITSENYNGKTFEQLNDATGALANGITPVSKTLFFDLLANNWHLEHDKPEGMTIINDTTFAVINDNDYQVNSPNLDGSIVKTGKTTTMYIYTLPQSKKLNYVAPRRLLTENVDFGRTGQMQRVGTQVKNTSNTSALTATTAGVSGNGSTSYLFYQSGTSTPVAPTTTISTNGSLNVDVVFGVQGMTGAGRRTAQWNIQHTGTNSPVNVELTGYFASLAVANGSDDLLVPGAKLVFGDVNVNAVGSASMITKTVSVGPDSVLPATAPLLVSSYSISGPDAALFSITSGLQAGMVFTSARSATIMFNGGGATPGVKRATLTLNHTAANGPATVIQLEARVGRSVLSAPTLVSLPSVRQGQTYTSAYENVALIPLAEGAFANVTMTGAPQLFGVDAQMMELLTNTGKVYIAGAYDSNGNVVVGGDGDVANPANWLATPATVMQNRPLLLAVRMKQPVAGMPVGTYSAQLVIAGSGNSGADNTVTAAVVGQLIADPNAAPGIIDFGVVPVGTALNRTLTLRNANAGWVTLTIPANNNFTFAGGLKMTTMYVPGGGVPINTDLSFTPQTGGAQQALLAVTGLMETTITLKGTGDAPLLSSVRFQYNGAPVGTVNFGSVVVGQTVSKNITIVNDNVGPVWISTVSRSGSTPTQFSVGAASAMIIPGNGGSVTLPVTFVPTSLSPAGKSAIIEVAFPGTGTLSFAVTGTAIATGQPAAALVLSPTSWNFGTATTTKTFTLTNNLSTPVTLSAALITSGARFAVTDAPATFPRTLAANGGTTTVTVQYTAGSGPAAGALLLYTPGIAVYPTATLQGGNYARAGSQETQESGVAGFSALELDGTYPNPFVSSTEVRFRLNRSVVSTVLRVYDVLGHRIAEIDGGALASGVHSFRFDATTHNAGVYYYTLEADGESRSGIMMVTK